jgi:segregation and condensation protein A
VEAVVSGEEPAAKFESEGGMRFSVGVYEGPLDLLLHLIKRAELDAHDVTASLITDQYLQY